MLNWADVYAQQEQRNDRIRYAEERRLINECSAHAAGSLHRHALAWVGHQLMTWGERLEARYGEPYRESYREMRHELL